MRLVRTKKGPRGLFFVSGFAMGCLATLESLKNCRLPTDA